jgi:hypothetical protein
MKNAFTKRQHSGAKIAKCPFAKRIDKIVENDHTAVWRNIT